MNHLFSKNINTKLAFVLIIILLLCFGFILLTKNLFSDFRKQQEQYRISTQVLMEMDDLLSQFYEIQEYGNLFLVQKETRFLKTYQSQIDSFQCKLEHIVQITQHEEVTQYLADIILLLHNKKIMLKRLQQLFDNKKEIDFIYHKIAAKIEEEMYKDMLQPETITTMVQDTVWQEHKSFGKRLRDAFRSSKKRGKNIAATHTLIIIDTISQQHVEVNSLLDSLQEFTQLYQLQHATKIEKIETELYGLLTADQYITKEITFLLLKLHEDMLLNVISLGEEYEEKAQLALMRSAFTGAVALLLVTVFIVFIFRNIRTIRIAYKALAVEKQKTEALMESRHQLLLAISHDIKTPLNSILGYLELWEKETLSAAQLSELNTMQYSGKYMLLLLNNLLEYSRLEQQKTQITQESIETVPFFMEIIEMFQPLCHEKKNKIYYRFAVKENPQILIDALKLRQIAVNLISNAVKYTSKGDINVVIEEICEPNLYLKITISDNGKGIPHEKLATLFEAFTRVEENSSGIEGTGLGLFVVKGLLDLLGGTIEIQTEENRGTTISFTAPFHNVLETAQPIVLHPEPLKIWVIEDDTTQLQVMASMLQKLGHSMISSATKEEFEMMIRAYQNMSEQSKNIPCDMVFTDLNLGDLSGYEVLQIIKSLFPLQIICLSGNTTTSKTELQQLGFDDFLEKPFSIHQLEKIITSIRNKKIDFASNLFSLQTLNELFDNDHEVVSTLLNTFTTSLPNDIQKFERALAEENLFLAQNAAHKILPFCKQISANKVVHLLEKIEFSKKQTHIQFSDIKEDVLLAISGLKELLTVL